MLNDLLVDYERFERSVFQEMSSQVERMETRFVLNDLLFDYERVERSVFQEMSKFHTEGNTFCVKQSLFQEITPNPN